MALSTSCVRVFLVAMLAAASGRRQPGPFLGLRDLDSGLALPASRAVGAGRGGTLELASWAESRTMFNATLRMASLVFEPYRVPGFFHSISTPLRGSFDSEFRKLLISLGLS